MNDRRKKCSMNAQLIRPSEFYLINSDKTLNTYKNELINANIQSSIRVATRKKSEKINIDSSISTREKSWIDDRPSPEDLSIFYNLRKKIIFGLLNIKENEKEILKLIYDSQKNANDIKKGQSGFFLSPHQIYKLVIALKENIANYSLVFHLYINNYQKHKANELFLLMDQQNKELLTSISNEIKKNFKNMTNSNRIGKFYPTIIKLFFQILSVVIKFSSKFNKNLIENYYLKMYIHTMHNVRETIINRFTSSNNELENDYKLIGRFFYYDCIYKISIYFLYRYQPLNIIISIFQFINEQYHGKDIVYLINSEQILLLKMYYNLGLLYYVDGNNMEAIVNLNQAKGRLKEIIIFPYTTIKYNYNPVSKSPLSTNKINTNDYSNNNFPDRSSISSFNIDESVDKYVTGSYLKKRSISSRVGGDCAITEKNFDVKKFSSNIIFGKDKFICKEQTKFINDCLSQKVEIEIELLLAEIELDQKNFKESFAHVNKILDTVRQPSKKYTKEKIVPPKKTFNFDNSSLNNSTFLKWEEYNKTSYSNNVITNSFNLPKIKYCQTISESNKRHISYILEEIEQEYKKRNEYITSNNEINNIITYDFKTSSKSDRFEYDKRLNENINRERKISLETEKFFIFICGLSIYQLKILNEFQPEPSKKRDDLPILFPNQFKDCLTFSQRLALNNLDTMSLSRYVILKDSNKDISPENLDYVFLTRKIKSSHKDKNFDLISSRNNNQYLNEFMLKLSKKSGSSNSADSSGGSNKVSKKNVKINLFDKERFQKFVEEDKIFNQKITEITQKDNKNFLEKNRNRILKVLHSLQPKEKQLLMTSSSCLNNFLKKIEKKMSKRKIKSEDDYSFVY